MSVGHEVLSEEKITTFCEFSHAMSQKHRPQSLVITMILRVILMNFADATHILPTNILEQWQLITKKITNNKSLLSNSPYNRRVLISISYSHDEVRLDSLA
jgi:hypothetical protein